MNFDLALFCFFNSRWVCSFPMHGLPLCLWVVLENSSLIAGTVITLSKNLGFSSICFEMSAQISWRFSFWSLVKSFETTWAQTFVICSFSCSTCHTVSLSMDILSAISRIVSRRSSRTIFSISRLLLVVFDTVGRRERSSSSTSVRPSWNLLCHSKSGFLTWILCRKLPSKLEFYQKFQVNSLLSFRVKHFSAVATELLATMSNLLFLQAKVFSDTQKNVHLLSTSRYLICLKYNSNFACNLAENCCLQLSAFLTSHSQKKNVFVYVFATNFELLQLKSFFF